MFQENVKIHKNKDTYKTILVIILFITTIIFLILFIKEKKQNESLIKNISLYKPDKNNYIPIKEQLYKNIIEGAKNYKENMIY